MRTSESTMDIYGNHCNQIYQLKLSTKVAEKLCQAMSHLVWIRNFPKMCGMEHVWEGRVVGHSVLIISSSNSKIPIGRSLGLEWEFILWQILISPKYEMMIVLFSWMLCYTVGILRGVCLLLLSHIHWTKQAFIKHRFLRLHLQDMIFKICWENSWLFQCTF